MYNLKKAINFDYVVFFYNFYVTDTMGQVLEYVLDNLQDLNFMLCIQTQVQLFLLIENVL